MEAIELCARIKDNDFSLRKDLSVCLGTYLLVYLSAHLFVYVCLFVCLPIHLFGCSFVVGSLVCLGTYLLVYLSRHLVTLPSIDPSMYS